MPHNETADPGTGRQRIRLSNSITGSDRGKIGEERGGCKRREGPSEGRSVYFRHTIKTSFGNRLAAPPQPLAIPTSPSAALQFARDLDREADILVSQGKHAAADTLAHAAYEARCRAEGRAT